ncbi:MAG: T9SS type A sorting domain-containing protein, partial [Bacteroidota bacterium]
NIPMSATLGDYAMRVGFGMPYAPAMFAVTGAAAVGAIKGNIFHDVNEDCIPGGAEPDLSGFIVHVTPGDYYAMTNSQGEYQALVPPGNYSLDVLPPKHYSRLCPTSPISANVASAGSTNSGNDFAMDVDTVSDGGISCAAPEFRPGFTTVVFVTVNNVGITPLTGTAELVLDTALNFLSSQPISTQSGDTIRWNVAPAIPAGGSRIYKATVQLPVYIPLGYILTNEVYFHNDSVDVDGEDNYFPCEHVVIGSYDPNDKTAYDQDGNLADPYFDETDSVLIYRIRFQNTGTASAINIFIRDTLDPLLDIGTMEIIGVSHLPYTMNVSGNGNIEWRFPEIHLPDSNTNEPASHGFILYKIKPKPGFVEGMTIENQAHIYFDFNPPILTNITSTAIPTSTGPPVVPTSLHVFPNPVSDLLHVELECASATGVECTLFSPTGVGVREYHVACRGGKQRFGIPVKGLSAGVYFLETRVGEQRMTRKVVVSE